MLQQKIDSKKGVLGKKGSGKLVLLVFIVLLAAAGTAAWYFLGREKKADETPGSLITVEKSSLDLSISASGIIRPIQEVKISPKQTGLIKKLFVKQGDVVKKGDLIALMDDSNLIGQVEAARSAMHLAQANYDKLLRGNRPQEIKEAEAQMDKAEDGVSFAMKAFNRAQSLVKSKKAELIRDKVNANRMVKLAKEGAVSDQDRLNAVTVQSVASISLEQAQQELAQAAAAVEQAKAELDSYKQRLSLLRAGSREEDKRAARHSVAQARGQLKFLESQLNDCRIRAPFEGVISQKYADVGAIVTPTTASATTSATSSSIVSLAGKLEMVASVSETDMAHLKVGQKTRIIANAYPDKQFQGTVTLIAPAAVVTQNVTTFEVHSSIDDDHKRLLMAGMNVKAEFLAGTLDDVLVIPAVCIISEKGKTGVLVPGADDKPTFRRLKIGRTAGNKTRVLRGLEPGDQVFVSLTEAQLAKHGYDGAKWGRRGKSVGRKMGMPRRK